VNDNIKTMIWSAIVGAVLGALGMSANKINLEPIDSKTEHTGLLGRLRRDHGDLDAGLATLHIIRANDRRATIHVATDSHEWLLTVDSQATLTPLATTLPSPVIPRPRIGDAP
jgi:hypothetical protein